jgi:hypothetical protein
MNHNKLFIAAIAILTIAGFNSCEQKPNENKIMEHSFSHHVFFWLNNPDDPADRAAFEKCIQELVQIPEIRSWHLGIPADVPERPVVDASYTYSYQVFFDNIEGHDIYQDHPLHHKFIEDCSHLWSKVLVYDSVME